MKTTSTFLLALAFLSFQACESGQNASREEPSDKETAQVNSYDGLPDLLISALEAHGGLEKWKDYRTLTYTVTPPMGNAETEQQMIDLQNRKVKLTSENYTIGMDGEHVWVMPSKEAFGTRSARFYHNLLFYFYAMPFVLADDGINYEDLGTVEVMGTSYRALKVTYEAGVGDTPKDYYIAHFNPESYKLELLLYTVTYFSGEATTNYNSLLYPDWEIVDGLLVPTVLEGHKFENDSIKEVRYNISFSDIDFDTAAVDQSLFEMPAGAEIDSLSSK